MNLCKKLGFIGVLVLLPMSAQAAIHLSANPADGGTTLRLGRVDGALEITKAVKLRISSSDGKQYQVFQRLEDSLTNERQNILDAHAFHSYAASGSNGSGTVYAQQDEPLRMADQLIYTSSPDGQSDTLTMVYGVDAAQMNASGNFTGRIAYTVRSLGDGGQDQVILNVYLEASGQLKVEVAGATVHDGVRLKYNHRFNREDIVRVSFSGNVGDEVKIYQEAAQPPQDDLGRELEGFEFTASGAKGETYFVAPEAVSRKRVLLYKSQESEDEFDIQFALNAERAALFNAGTYRGKIRLTVEAAGGSQEYPLDVEVTVDPIFEVSVQLPPGGIRFSHVLPTDPPQTQEVDVEVKTNLGKPYTVIHSMATPMTTAKGDEIKADSFTMKTELDGNVSGRIAAGEFAPVKTGETTVFYSDGKGSPAKFKVFYRLRAYADIAAGDYSAPIVFSLGEM